MNWQSVKRAWRFVKDEVWMIDTGTLSKQRRFGIVVLRVGQLVFRGFREDACPLHASALTFYTLLALVPFLAVVLLILKGFGAGADMEQRILESVAAMPDQFQEFVRDALAQVRNINYPAMGGIGLVILFWMVVQVLSRVEWSFNRVWGISASRPMLRKFSDYLSFLVVVPALMLASTAINTTLNSEAFVELMQARLGPAAFLYKRLLLLMPWLVTWVAFAFMYKFVPNTRVRVIPAIVSGIIGGSLWIGWQVLYIRLQYRVGRYNMIYGTFASVPIFLAWLFVSWEIVLLGAELAFAIQNFATFALEQRAQDAGVRSKFLLAVSILARAAGAILGKNAAFEIGAYAEEKLIPVRLLHDVVDQLHAAGLLSGLSDEPDSYVLTRAPETILIKDVWDVLARRGRAEPFERSRMEPRVVALLEKADAGLDRSLKEISVRDLVESETAPPPAAAAGGGA